MGLQSRPPRAIKDFWLSNHVKQDVGQTEMLINVKIVEGRKASYRDLISLELQKVKENNVEELQHTRALLLDLRCCWSSHNGSMFRCVSIHILKHVESLV